VARLWADVPPDALPVLMVTDPPYGVEYDSDWRLEAGINKPWQTLANGKVTNDDRSDWTATWALFPGNVAYVWHSALHSPTVAASLQANKFEIRAQIIWAKPALVMGRGHYHWQHEPCWYAVREGKTSGWIGDRKQTTLWDIANMHATQGDVDDGKTVHSTQKPVACMRRPMVNHEGNVYDPFLGSGTTICAAEQAKRQCFGLELEPKYVAVILERLSDMGLKPKLAD
jgi:DNA modification methylase